MHCIICGQLVVSKQNKTPNYTCSPACHRAAWKRSYEFGVNKKQGSHDPRISKR